MRRREGLSLPEIKVGKTSLLRALRRLGEKPSVRASSVICVLSNIKSNVKRKKNQGSTHVRRQPPRMLIKR